MKYLIFSDIHWSANSSIVQAIGDKYTVRLEYLIKSMNWVNEFALTNKCEAMICAGDFFDKSHCTDEELTALRDINWNNLPCYFICGNHESSVSDLRYNALKVLEAENHYIISNQFHSIKTGNTQIHFVPYISEVGRAELVNYLKKDNTCLKHIIVSHNDIAGIQYGSFVSKIGFCIDEIESACDLYLNGHLHNSEWITDKILNVGSFSGHNFSNDSNKYKYGIWILDTDTLKVTFYENPFALNFYKLTYTIDSDIASLDKIKNNACLSLKYFKSLEPQIIEVINKLSDKIVALRTFILQENTDIATDLDSKIQELQSDPREMLVNFCKDNLPNTAVLMEELAEICK